MDASQHRAAADDNRRQVQPGCSHEHAGHNLVAVGDHDHGIKGMGNRHHLDRVCNELPARQ